MSIKEISTLLVKGVHAHQHLKLVADQVLQVPTGRQQNLQHHLDEPKAEPLHLIEPQRLIELQVELQAGHQHHRQIDRHHQTDLLPQIEHPHHHALQAQAVRAAVAAEAEDDKFFWC